MELRAEVNPMRGLKEENNAKTFLEFSSFAWKNHYSLFLELIENLPLKVPTIEKQDRKLSLWTVGFSSS